MVKESVALLELFDKIGDEEKAQLAIALDKLSHGSLTKKTDIEIKINSKKVSLQDYIEEVLPQVDFKTANEKVDKYLKEINEN